MSTGRLAGCAALVLLTASGAAAQEVRVAVTPDTVTVGDVFHAAIRVEVPPGFRLEPPDSLPVSGDVENAGRRIGRSEPIEGGGERVTLAYPLTAWRPGPVELPALALRLVGPGEEAQTLNVRLPAAVVRSVLPADTTGVEPRPLKDVLGADRVLWPLLLALALALLAAAALSHWLRRRRAVSEPALAAGLPPRERALAALDRARRLGLLEAGEVKAFYTLIADAVREYLEAVEPRWGRDLTTSELLALLAGEMDESQRERLGEVLHAADLVKFARRRPDASVAIAEWQAARDWVASFERPLAGAGVAAEAERAEPNPEGP
ncbi:MAG: hypothetical protein DIU52_004800 [bacterium]|jgi:hypothetical protein|nr:MAG: hypothetical protein DIU52_11560 [bacterium]